MPPQTLVKRVAILEHTMQSLEGLPDRVASLEVQFVQFRVEVREEFSAVRGEIRRLGETLRLGIDRHLPEPHGPLLVRLGLRRLRACSGLDEQSEQKEHRAAPEEGDTRACWIHAGQCNRSPAGRGTLHW